MEILQELNQELAEHLTRMEGGRHEWLEQKADLEESLEESFQDLQVANERLNQLEEELEATELQRARLE